MKKLETIAGAGGGGGCFRKGTQIQLEHNKTIAIEELKVGDEILAFDESGEIHLAKVTKVHYHADPQPLLRIKFWRGEMTGITPNHWVLNSYGNFAEMGHLTIHDALVDGMGHLRPITDAEYIGHEPVWNLTVEPHHTFIADGIRVHNGGHRDRYPVVAGAGGGDSSKSSSGRAAVEDPDSLQSRAMVSVVDLIGEGQIGGLISGGQSIFLNDTPLLNADGGSNFSGVTWDFRDGTQNQTPMAGFSDVEIPTAIGVKVMQSMPVTCTLSSAYVDAVRCLVAVPSLASTDTSTGDVHGSSVSFRFYISVNNGSYQALSDALTISGKTRSRYQRSYYFTVPHTDLTGKKAVTWTVKMVRLTADATTGAVANEVYFDTLTEVIQTKLSYPNSALVGVSINSQLFSEIPRRAYLVSGLLIRVPSNYDPKAKTYSGIWDGTFKLAVSSNPAWVLFDLLTHERYGLGQYLSASQIDTAKLYQIGRYCDEQVSDGYGNLEPRFTINTAFQTLADAYKLISDLCSVFNGMAYWNGSMVAFTQDSPTDPSMVFNQANVIDGLFQYSGSSRKDRHSVALVTWNDPDQNFKQVVEYVEDADLIERWGIRKAEIVAFGCSSRGQAHRAGRWLLYTEKYESNIIQFKVGIDAALVLPGDVVKIHDSTRAGKRMGGRLKASTTTSATLDSPIEITGEKVTISIRLPDGKFEDRVIAQDRPPGEYDTVTWKVPLSAQPVDSAIWLAATTSLQPMLARVVGLAQGDNSSEFVITAVEHYANKYDTIENDMTLVRPKTSAIDPRTVTTPSELTILEVPYQVAPGVQGLSLDLSWYAGSTNTATSYEISWCRTGKYETNWETTATSVPNFELKNVRSGTYYFRIVGINSLGARSAALTTEYTTEGRTAAPGDVANFAVTKRSSDLLLTWDAVSDISILGYEVRTGASWDEGTVITTNFAGTMITHDQDYAGTYYYHIRSINMEGAYSDNVSTVELVLTAPATPTNFDIVQSGTRLELHWAANAETDIAYYEIREGASWGNGVLVSQVNATTFTIPAGTIGTRKFFIKAVAAPGIYCETAAWIVTDIASPVNTNIIAVTDEKALGWPGNKLNMHMVGYDLMMDDGVARSEYIFAVDLLGTYKASNSIYATVDSVVYGTDTMTWLATSFDWDDADAARSWAPNGDVDSVTAKYQITRKTGLRTQVGELDGWRLNDSLTSVNGVAAKTGANAVFATGRHANGLHVRGGVVVDWENVSVPEIFRYSLWMVPKMISTSAQVTILELANTTTGKKLQLGYSEPDQCFVLEGSDGARLQLPFDLKADNVMGVVIMQTEGKRTMFVGRIGEDPIVVSLDATPLGTFNALRLYWT